MNLRQLVRWSLDRGVVGGVAMSGLAVSVLLFGPTLLGRAPTDRFLAWNLALAWVPFVAAVGVDLLVRLHRRVAAAVCGVIWFVFLPNAPYLVSDLTHFRHDSATPWLDLTRFVAFGLAGCVLAIASLRIVHVVVARRAGAWAGWLLVAAATLGSGIGVVLGRFSRLNSWQLVTAPSTVVNETFRLAGNRPAIAIGLFFSLLIAILYVTQFAVLDVSHRQAGTS